VVRGPGIHSMSFCIALTLAACSFAFAQTESNRIANQNTQPEDKIYSGKEVTKKVKILFKPTPEYTGKALENRVEGVVVIRAIFRASGKVTNITAIKTLPDGLTEQSVEAARKIKFTPAEKDGLPVSMFMQLEYHFKPYPQ
jgi:TonB family protein